MMETSEYKSNGRGLPCQATGSAGSYDDRDSFGSFNCFKSDCVDSALNRRLGEFKASFHKRWGFNDAANFSN